MGEFFESMDANQRFYWYVAIGASVVFIIQTIMTFIGADADSGVDADFDGNLDGGDHPFQLFSLRNLISFLLGFGWTGASLYGAIDNKVLLGIIAALVGSAFIAIFFLIMKALMKLSEDNSFKVEDTIGKMGEVYVNIPPSKTAKGKISVSVRGSTHELAAITTDHEIITSGTLVKIIALEGETLVVVPMTE